MTLLRLYLDFFNSGAAWTVYAARNQNLSVQNDVTVPSAHIQAGDQSTPLHGQFTHFWQWLDRNF